MAPPPPPPPPPPPAPPAGITAGAAASAVFNAINATRIANHLPPLQWNSGLSRSAHLHDLEMAAFDTLSHQLPGEPSLGTRVSQQGVPWSWAGENIGMTTSLSTGGALGLESMMLNDAYHRANILSSSATMVGVDAYIDTAHGILWLTEDFAN